MVRDRSSDKLPARITRRWLLGSAGTLAVTAPAAAMAACSAGGQSDSTAARPKLTQPASLIYWTILGGADGTRMHDLTQQYVKETPLVTIEDIQGVPDFLIKFTASIVAGSPPDVVGIRQTYVPGFAEKNGLLEFSARELSQAGLRAEDFDSTVWKASEYKSKRYTIPIDIHGYQLIWNEPAVREGGVDPARPPATWTDLQEWISRLTVGDRFGGTVQFSGGGLIWGFQGYLRQAARQLGSDADLFTADGRKSNFNNVAGNTALTFMADLWKRAKHPLPTGPGNALLDLFEQRRMATTVNGPWNLNRLAAPGGPAYNDVRVSLCPQRDPAKPAWWAQSHQLALGKPQKIDDHKRAAAFDFMKWISEHTFEWSKAGQVPANKKVLGSEQYQKSDLLVHKLLKVWEQNLASAAFMQLHPKYVELEVELAPPLARGVMNEVSPQSALADAEQIANTLINR